MGGNTTKMIVPMVLAVAAPYAAGAALGVGSSAGLATGVTAKAGVLTAGTKASLLSKALVPIANTSFMGSLVTGAGLAYANSMSDVPEQPDFSQQFGQQQACLRNSNLSEEGQLVN